MSLPAHKTTVSRPDTYGFALALAGVAFIGAGAVMSVASEVGPMGSAFWRFLLGAAICGFMTRLVNGPGAWDEILALFGRRDVWIAGLAFVMVVALWYSGMRLSSVATTSALHNLSPLVLTLSAWLIYARVPSARVIAGIAVALSGSVTLAAHSGSISGQALSGDLLALASAVFLAIYYSTVTSISRDVHPWTLMTVLSSICAVPFLGMTLMMEEQIAPWTVPGWAIVIGLALACQLFGQSCLAQASRKLGAFRVTAVTLSEPACSALMASAVLSAPLYPVHVLGIALIGAGLWVIMQPEVPSRARVQPA